MSSKGSGAASPARAGAASVPRIIICTTDDECPEHGRFIYFCRQCHERWAEANPERVAAINTMANTMAPPARTQR